MKEEIVDEVIKTQQKVTMYIAEDGTKFRDKDSCMCYELKSKWNNWLEKFNVEEIDSEDSSTYSCQYNFSNDTIIFKYCKEYDSEIREFLKAYSRYYKDDKHDKIHARYLNNILLKDLEDVENEIDEKEFIDKEVYKFTLYYNEGDVDYENGTYEVEFSGWKEESAKLRERIQELEKIFGKKFTI